MTATNNAREGDGVADHVAMLQEILANDFAVDESVGMCGFAAERAALKAAIAAMQAQQGAAPKLIGWRTDNYLMETADKAVANNWECHYRILPIFEGDPNTKLTVTGAPR